MRCNEAINQIDHSSCMLVHQLSRGFWAALMDQSLFLWIEEKITNPAMFGGMCCTLLTGAVDLAVLKLQWEHQKLSFGFFIPSNLRCSYQYSDPLHQGQNKCHNSLQRWFSNMGTMINQHIGTCTMYFGSSQQTCLRFVGCIGSLAQGYLSHLPAYVQWHHGDLGVLVKVQTKSGEWLHVEILFVLYGCWGFWWPITMPRSPSHDIIVTWWLPVFCRILSFGSIQS